MKKGIDYYQELVEEIDATALELNDWEVKFIANMVDKPSTYIFSVDQRSKIQQIYDERMN